MALTLVEAAKLESGDVVRAAIIELLARTSDLMRVMPFTDITGNAYKYNREGSLPGIGFRGLNKGFTESVGVINPQVEQLVIAGGDLDVDEFIIDTQGASVRASHEAMKVKALSSLISQKFIKGDSVTTAKEFDGLEKRLGSGGQVLSNDTTTDGAALSVAKLDEVIDLVDSPTHLLMLKKHRRLLTAAARTTTVGGYITYDQDAFGRKVTQYNDLPILIADGNADNDAALDESEDYTGGGTGDGSSIYVLSLGEGMLSGIQNGGMDVRDLGELESKSVFRTRVEWYVSALLEHPRSAARLRDIDAALAAVA